MVERIQGEPDAAAALSSAESEALRRYNASAFDLDGIAPGTVFPLPDEAFVAAWEAWSAEARERSAFAVLAERLPQLRFPIRAGISQSEAYRAATRQGVPADELPEATGLELAHPEAVELVLHPSAAGRIPLILVRQRAEFVTLVRALAGRNEPIPVPEAQGAAMIGGYNDWARLGELRRRWEALPPGERETATWSEELASIVPHRELYQDRFMVLSDGPYSGVPASELGLTEGEWRERSLLLRRDHECTHYFTRRLFGSMRNHLLDELVADFLGMLAAFGGFRADLELRFLGVGEEDAPRPGGRLALYLGDPPLVGGALAELLRQVRAAAASLQRFDVERERLPPGAGGQALLIAALASLRLDELAAAGAEARLHAALAALRRRLATTTE